jgi:hypothetical protein
MKKSPWIVSILLVLSFVPIAHAQFGKTSGPKFYSDFKPVVGGWAEYQMTSKGERSTKMKIAIVGKENDAYWYESVMGGGQQGRIITKMLVSSDPGDTKNIKRMIFKKGNEPAMEMPVQMMQQSSKGQERKGKAVDKGSETIKVPAGTFTTQHMKYQGGEIAVDSWVDKEVSTKGTYPGRCFRFACPAILYCTVFYSHHPFFFAIVSSLQSPNSQARFQSEQAFSLLPDFI